MPARPRDPRTANAEQYAAKAARAAQQGDPRRAAELYRAAIRALATAEEGDEIGSGFAFSPDVKEAVTGIRVRGENEAGDRIATARARDEEDDALRKVGL